MAQELVIGIKLDRVSLQSLLQAYLLRIVTQGELGQPLAQSMGQLTIQQIPVYRLKDIEQCTYRCSVALAMAKRLSVTPEEVANKVWRKLCQAQTDGEQVEGLRFQVRLVTGGWLELTLADPLGWLGFVLEHPPQGVPSLVGQDQDLFSAQYAHARCCSLLRLAQSQNLVRFRAITNLGDDLSVPFLTMEVRDGSVEEVFPNPQARKLLGTLMAVIDGSDSLTTREAVKQVKALSQVMLEFYAHCRIWGEIQRDYPQLMQRRLALLAGVQIWLRWLLECRVGVVAPREL